MDWEAEAKKALKRVNDLEKEVAALKSRVEIQSSATEELRRRIAQLERGTPIPSIRLSRARSHPVPAKYPRLLNMDFDLRFDLSSR
jgi:hypothetical protein